MENLGLEIVATYEYKLKVGGKNQTKQKNKKSIKIK